MERRQIGSEKVIEDLPCSLRTIAMLERNHLYKAEQFQDLSSDPQFAVQYLPQNCGAIKLPCFWIDRKHVYVYGRQASNTSEQSLSPGSGRDDEVLFPVHPASLGHYQEFLSQVKARDGARERTAMWGVPTSSTRTFLAWPDGAPERALFLKTSLHSPVLGDRRLTRSKVGCSVGLSALVCHSQPLPDKWGCFAEPLGFVPRGLPNSGAIVRSIPNEIKHGISIPVPLFSLLGGNARHPPLLLTVARRARMDPLEIVDQVLCDQFARLWLELSMRFGLILEAHAQDLMLELSPDLREVRRFLYRDFEGLQVDWELRRRRGLLDQTALPHAFHWYETYATWGYPLGYLVSYKLRTSLFHYLHFVLNEVEICLRTWEAQGLTGPRKFDGTSVTMIFSRHMMKALEEMFGVRVGAKYDIYHSLNRFVILLMRLRRESLRPAPTCGAEVSAA
jgi:hypothetical protein